MTLQLVGAIVGAIAAGIALFEFVGLYRHWRDSPRFVIGVTPSGNESEFPPSRFGYPSLSDEFVHDSRYFAYKIGSDVLWSLSLSARLPRLITNPLPFWVFYECWIG
jgi:hypothetical protein